MNKESFIIAENNYLYRLGLSEFIQRHTNPSAELIYVIDKTQLQTALSSKPNSVVILDVDSFEIERFRQLSNLPIDYPSSSWLFIAENADVAILSHISASYNNANFVLKNNSSDVLNIAFVNTLSGYRYFCGEALEVLLNNQQQRKTNTEKRKLLTSTEMGLLQLFAEGKTAKEIALIRCLSHHTINTHRKNIFHKLNIRSVPELIKFALKNELIDLTEYYI